MNTFWTNLATILDLQVFGDKWTIFFFCDHLENAPEWAVRPKNAPIKDIGFIGFKSHMFIVVPGPEP